MKKKVKTILTKVNKLVGGESKLPEQRSAKLSKLPEQRSAKPAFTLIELLVASILLGMIVTILTMIFNQSSIAWRTGVGNVVNLNQSRRALGTFHDIRDDVLPGLGQQNVAGGAADNRQLEYRTVSLWDKNQRNALRQPSSRAFSKDERIVWGNAWQFAIGDARTAVANDPLSGSDDANPNGRNGFSVGVRSLGPDGKPDTPDDINTWPEEID